LGEYRLVDGIQGVSCRRVVQCSRETRREQERDEMKEMKREDGTYQIELAPYAVLRNVKRSGIKSPPVQFLIFRAKNQGGRDAR
jgi:hypothetical protein